MRDYIRQLKKADYNSFTLSPKRWIETTNAVGIVSKAGRHGGTYAHKDIATEDFHSALRTFFKSLNVPLNYIAEEPAKPQDIL